MKMLLMTDAEYQSIVNEIKSDISLKDVVEHIQGVHCNDSKPWDLKIAQMLLNGAISVADRIADTKPSIASHKTRIRYGYDSKCQRRNVLYTIKDEDKGLVYFGISRCDIKFDKFNREKGIELAKLRAEAVAAKGYNCGLFRPNGSKRFVANGAVWAGDIKGLITWFDELEL